MKLICFDVDGTLIDLKTNAWFILNREYNFQIQDDILFKEYRKGNITYQEWVNQDFWHYTLMGLNKENLKNLFNKHKTFPGAHETLKILKERHIISVLSGSIDFLLSIHALDSFFEQVLINRVIFDGERIVKVEATPYDIEGKIEGMKYLLQLTHKSIEDFVYVGDGDNDIPLSRFIKKNGGTFIAFNSRSNELRDNARYVVDSRDMRDVLPYTI